MFIPHIYIVKYLTFDKEYGLYLNPSIDKVFTDRLTAKLYCDIKNEFAINRKYKIYRKKVSTVNDICFRLTGK